MGVLYYKYKSGKESYPVQLPHSFISVSKLKQLILSSKRHGVGRSRGRGPREDVALSNAQTGEEYADENAMIPQNVTVLVRRTTGQGSENIVLFSSRKVIEDGSVPSVVTQSASKSVVTESVSRSCSSTEVKDEDAAIAAVIDAAGLKWEEQSSKRGQAAGKFTSGRQNGEAPPPGYVCRRCGVAGHFIQHCPQENQAPPPGYTCYRCRIPGHFIQHCPTIGDSKFDNYKMSRPVNGILSALAPAASVSEVDDLPAELHCQLCNKVMADAVLTSKCCFVSFCDKCIQDYIMTQSKCVCGVKVLADSLIPNPTVRNTISNLLGTRTCSTASGTGTQRSSAGSNPDPKSQSHTTSAALETVTKQLSPASPDARLQVAPEGDQVDRPQKDSDLKSNTGGSAGRSAEKAVPSADLSKLNDVSESTLTNGAISGSFEPKVARPDQLKKKRKKADSSKAVHPNNADYGYNGPFDSAYCNPFNGGYPMDPFGVPEPYMYGSMGMPYGGYPMGMGPFGVDPFGNIPQQALAMQGYPPNYQSWETQAAAHRDAEAAARSRQVSDRNTQATARSRQTERPKDSGAWPQPSESNRRLGSPHGRESRDRPQSRPEPSERSQHLGSPHGRESRDRSRSRCKPSERSQCSGSPRGRESRDRSLSRSVRSRGHGRSDRGSSDYHEDHHDRKRVRAPSTVDGDTESTKRSRHSSRSLSRDDGSDDEQNFKRKWGR